MRTIGNNAARSTASIRDPAGFVFFRGTEVYRQVLAGHRTHYEALVSSGLLAHLESLGLVLPHAEADRAARFDDNAFVTLKTKRLPIVSYPHEWTFEQLRDAALTTLRCQALALRHGLTLKDASAQNIQFWNGRPVLIDILSFERYVEGNPWVAYRQFCMHFLGPLVMMRFRDARLGRLLASFEDGVPLELVAKLLPFRAKLRMTILLHLVLHARAQRRGAAKQESSKQHQLPKKRLAILVESLETFIRRLDLRETSTWANYESRMPYTDAALRAKKAAVEKCVERIRPQVVWDIGANTGAFSSIASKSAGLVIAADADERAANQLYRRLKADGIQNVLPLVIDFATWNSGVCGGAPLEPPFKRAKGDLVLGLALLHHLRISSGIPFVRIAEMMHQWGRILLLEFVPKDDPQTKVILRGRADVFHDYSWEGFTSAFSPYFDILEVTPLPESERRLVLFEARSGA